MHKRIVIHCGLHKTGTSYLQSIMRRNRELLAARSISYPEYLNERSQDVHDGNHSYLFVSYRGEEDLFDYLGQKLDPDYGLDTLLLSAEELSRPANLTPVLESLAPLRGKVEMSFVFYLRRFDHLLESVYAESVKRSLFGDVTKASYQLDFYKILQPVLDRFGQESLIVRPYNRALWQDGNLGQDFFTAIGRGDLWPILDKTESETKNVSLPRAQTYLLSRLRERSAKAGMLRFFETSPLKLPLDPDKYFMSPERRMTLNRNHHSNNRAFFDAIGFGDLGEMLDLYSFPEKDDWLEFQPYFAHFNKYLSAYIDALHGSPNTSL